LIFSIEIFTNKEIKRPFLQTIALKNNIALIGSGLKIFVLDDFRPTKVTIFKLCLDIGLKMWLFDDYEY